MNFKHRVIWQFFEWIHNDTKILIFPIQLAYVAFLLLIQLQHRGHGQEHSIRIWLVWKYHQDQHHCVSIVFFFNTIKSNINQKIRLYCIYSFELIIFEYNFIKENQIFFWVDKLSKIAVVFLFAHHYKCLHIFFWFTSTFWRIYVYVKTNEALLSNFFYKFIAYWLFLILDFFYFHLLRHHRSNRGTVCSARWVFTTRNIFDFDIIIIHWLNTGAGHVA